MFLCFVHLISIIEGGVRVMPPLGVTQFNRNLKVLNEGDSV